MKIQVKKIHPDAKIPNFALKGDAGMDLFSICDHVLKPGERFSCPTGISMKIPKNHAGLIWDKSGVSHRLGIKTLGGVIDSNYTGEWLVGLINLGSEDYVIEKGHKIAQVIIQKIEYPEIEEVAEIMEETERGSAGFGSTGKK
ncbi:MAG: dUTP diphosphatase [Candidatus Moranbacteria bacterium]|nr:dUTP diphosphatase [Candidatus Moranbacteria bacterium]